MKDGFQFENVIGQNICHCTDHNDILEKIKDVWKKFWSTV